MPCALMADNFGDGTSKPGTNFLRRRGNDVVEALMNGLSIAQTDKDLGALFRGECGGETGIAVQIG